MKLSFPVLLFCGVLVSSSQCIAQENAADENAAILPSAAIDPDIPDATITQVNGHPSRNTAVILQYGLRSNASIRQVSPVGEGDANSAYIVQIGADNEASIEQHGEGNLNLISQCGRNNRGEQETDGDHNRAILLQRGDGNSSVQILSGENLCSTIVQHGNDNQIYRVETGTGGLDYRIMQDGDGMRMVIVNGR